MRMIDPIGQPRYHEGYDWDLLVSSWADVFGQDNIVMQLYDEFVAENGEIITHIFGSIDLSLARLAREYAPVERSNPSLPAALIEFKRLANCVGAFDFNILPLLESVNQRGFGGPPFRMRREIAKGFLDIYRESNRNVAKRYFHRDGDLFDENDLEGEPTGADYTGNLPVETLAMLLALHLQDHAEQTNLLRISIEQLAAKVDDTLSKLHEPKQG
jgi:hypothetical protein